MPHAPTRDGVNLYYEEAGSGTPLVFVHEFAGDWRSWEAQMRHFSRYYRAITYSARGFKPSSIPADPAAYSQAHARDDIVAILDHLKIARAHIVGLSMGGFATLHVGITHPSRALSLTIAGCGYGAAPGEKEKFRQECETAARRFETEGATTARQYAIGPTRVQFQNKDPRGWAEFAQQLTEHDWVGQANTMRGVQMQRPSLWELVEDMKKVELPALIVTGDEDDPCLEPALLMKRNMPGAALAVLPRAGHTINLEDPEPFNRVVHDFLIQVDLGRWTMRDARSVASGILGFRK
ncbi:MAG: alpha/beta hydrolase [Burkholderiales bacterium]|nr:alpha/beta hydrolase [Burkholderiales bacterium]